MTQTVILTEDPFTPTAWERHDVEDVRELLMGRFATWPSSARIYDGQVAADRDVTPVDEAGVEALARLEGPIYVVVYPGDPVTIVVAIVAVVAVAAAAFLLAPAVPALSPANRRATSPNNELSERTNEARPLARIPDIFGRLRSTPDLLTVPYTVYEDHVEKEISYMCVGRGSYDVEDIREGTTPVDQVDGTSVEVYAPNTSPNSGDEPQLRVGEAISEPLKASFKSDSINGQLLEAPNAKHIKGDDDIYFEYPNLVRLRAHSEADLQDVFAAGDTVVIERAGSTANEPGFQSSVAGAACTAFQDGRLVFDSYDPSEDFIVGDPVTVSNATPEGLDGDFTVTAVDSTTLTLDVAGAWSGVFDGSPATVDVQTNRVLVQADLNGTYEVADVPAAGIMQLVDPAAVNSQWERLAFMEALSTADGNFLIYATGPRWVGPFVLDYDDLEEVVVNVVALNGLYKTKGSGAQRPESVTLELELTPVDASGSAIGPAETFQDTLVGSGLTTSTRALTIRATPSFAGPCSVRLRRVSDTDLEYEGQVVDEVKWRDLFALTPVPDRFGDVTTIYTSTVGTERALAVKERQLNLIVTRKLPSRVSGSTFTETLHATRSAADILSAIALDPYIGGRSVEEVDFDNLYSTVAAVEEHFGTPEAAEFSHTFDDDGMSFEETAAAVASAVFCTALRRGRVLQLSFERATDDSILLFNHRNKLPGSELRTVRFGTQDDHDGVEYQWRDPEDDSIQTYHIPVDKSAVRPKKVDGVGVRNFSQAYWHAWRIWNKVRYQHVTTEFEATQEAALLVLMDRVLVADNTRTGVLDGEVVSQDGLILELSQPVELDSAGDYTIFLQHYDGTVESLGCLPGTTKGQVILEDAPRSPLALDDDNFARTLYWIVEASDSREQAFLLTEKVPQNGFTYLIRAINYDARYYEADASTPA